MAEPPGGVADDDRTGRGDRLQAGGEIRRLAEDLVRTDSVQIALLADDDHAGGDADAGTQIDPPGAQRADLLGEGQPRAHRALGVVLVRARVAEEGEGSVPGDVGDDAAPRFDDLGDAGDVGAHGVAVLFRVEPGRHLGRAHQVGVDHCELAPLGLVHGARRRRRGGPDRGCGRSGGQFGNRLEQLLARAERQAKLLKVVIGQFGNNLPVDLVFPEHGLVSLEPELAKPGNDVHDGSPRVRARIGRTVACRVARISPKSVSEQKC